MFGTGGSFLLLHFVTLPLTNSWPVTEEVFQWWGEWSSWSSCSRSCGGGVRSQERHCLLQRLPTTQNINNSYCIGSPKQYQLCPNQSCPSNTISFKQHQCSKFNYKAFGRKHYSWIPLYPADYISISNKPCDLQCTTISGERHLLVPAHDGTFCQDVKYTGVCIEGICQPVGCDGQLYSTKTVDRCGVCGGNETSCQRVTGSYRRALTQLGYVFITKIPAGAFNIQIVERKKTENLLALSDETGHFFFNGNAAFDNPQNFQVAGTVVKYRRPSNVFSNGLEYIIAQGPTVQGLNVMYYNLNGKHPHVTYDYTIPLKLYNLTNTRNLTLDFPPSHFNLTNNRVNGDFRGDDLSVVPLREKKDGKVMCKIQIPSQPSPSPPVALQVYRAADVNEQRPPSSSDYSRQKVDSPAMPGDVPYMIPENIPQNYTEATTFSFSDTSSQAVDMAVSETHRDSLKVADIHSGINADSVHSAPTVAMHTAFLIEPQQVSAVKRGNTDSNDFDVSVEPDVGVADMYRWKVSAFTPCSSTCTSGISSSFALCVRYDGTEVDDSYCDSLSKPEPSHQFCTGKECPPRWETSGWSECSRTCGEGVQYRIVRCWKMLLPGLDSSVYDSLCLSHYPYKPASQKVCYGQSCGPQWEVSEWSECSARCGSRGLRTRDVRCSMELRLCDKPSQPIESQECEAPPCDRRWTVSDWGPCSGVCGEGRMTRTVTCRSSGGVVMSEDQCDQSLRPLAIYPCGKKDCAPHWVEQEWQQCNATCGRGVRQRQVVCAGLEGGVFKEFPKSSCEQTKKPESSSPCFQRPCTKWFTTSWSQCSKSCGLGVQVREVKCYQGVELVTRGHSCDSTLKPETRQSCDIQSCPTNTSVVLAASMVMDHSCQDKPTASCALVLKVKLCSHWYYRQACCQSCKTPRS